MYGEFFPLPKPTGDIEGFVCFLFLKFYIVPISLSYDLYFFLKS